MELLIIDVRRIKAEQLAAHIMHIVGPYISDFDGQRMMMCRNELFQIFYQSEAEMTTRAIRDLNLAVERLAQPITPSA